MATKAAAKKAVHRSLHVTSPLMRGPDVEQLQAVMQAFMQDHKIDWLPLNVDGQWGPQSRHAARFLTWVEGLGKGHRDPIKKHNTLTQATQRLLRDPRKRSRIERQRQRKRAKRLAVIRKRQSEGPAAACAYAKSFIGTTESPAGSNSGPTTTNAKGQKGGVTFWEAYWGLGPCFWCLCFASYCAKAIGGAKISGNCAYSVAIEGYAANHENGWIEIPREQARPGDISIWKFEGPNALSDHGELVTEVQGGHVGIPTEDTGGNTGPDSGSQSNGGGVFAKPVPGGSRDLSMLSMVVRPLYS